MFVKKTVLSLILLLAAFQAWAQLDSAALRLTRGRAELLVPRPALHPVKSLIPPVTAVGIDTIATENPIVKIVLMSDGVADALTPSEVAQVVRSVPAKNPKAAADALLENALRLTKKPDDMTVVCMRVVRASNDAR